MSRELLQRIIDVWYGKADDNLLNDIQAALEKPKQVEYRTITLENGRLTALTQTTDLHHGKYRLLAERLPD